MEPVMPVWLIILVLAVGAVAAFPLAIGICAFLGFIVVMMDRLTTECPGCGGRTMGLVSGITETYPTGKGTGRCYSCGRWFWSNDDRGWRDASDSNFDRWHSAGAS
jgi:hypothetical protein